MMLEMKLDKLCQEANRQLLSYRFNREKLENRTLPEREREAVSRWTQAIASAYTYLKRTDPERARAMVRLFGLYHPVPKYMPIHQRVTRLILSLNISESTLYRWRREILQLVVLHGVETGAIQPFTEGTALQFPEEGKEER